MGHKLDPRTLRRLSSIRIDAESFVTRLIWARLRRLCGRTRPARRPTAPTIQIPVVTMADLTGSVRS